MVAPLAVDLSYTAVKYEDEAEDDFRVDFNLYGYLHSQDDEDVRDNINVNCLHGYHWAFAGLIMVMGTIPVNLCH